MPIIALINNQTMLCENIIAHEKKAKDVQIDGFIAIDLVTTPAIDYVFENDTLVPIEGIGNGGIGDEYKDGKLVQPVPVMIEQPISVGIQEL